VVRPNQNTINCQVPSGIVPDSYDIKVVNVALEEDIFPNGFRTIFPPPALPFATETQQTILARWLDDIEDLWDTSVGTFIHAVSSAGSLELSKAYVRANDVVRSFFPQYARGGFLDLFGEGMGLIRNIAQRATGQITVNGANGTVVPVGTQFSTTVLLGQSLPTLLYESTASGTISAGSVVVPIRALQPGTAGNVGANQITRLASGVAGVTSVSNAGNVVGGTDNESDTDYRLRLLSFVRNPPAGGTKSDYIRWALEISGVGDAQCVPLARGAGTVDVLIVDLLFGVPAAGLITEVQDYIAPSPADEGGGLAPIGADVLVLAPDFITIDVSVDMVVDASYVAQDVIDAVDAGIIDYINRLVIGDDVLFNHIANVVHDTPGVLNFSSLLVEAGVVDIVIALDEKATPGIIASAVP
jgi:uncharacterized phage protein gp47/JayE